MDVEGSEYTVIESSSDEVLRRSRQISLEYHDSQERERIWNRLADAGFACVRHCPAGWSGIAEFMRKGRHAGPAHKRLTRP